jgi:hypothetical protein
MLTIPGTLTNQPLCDVISRRDFLRLGSLSLGGLTLPQLLQAEQTSGVGKSNKSIIMVYMAGAPPYEI